LHPELEQLLPERRTVAPGDAYANLRLGEHARAGRPYVVANMVETADGRATLSGRTKQISSDVDRELFLQLRIEVDAVMVGPATIAIEGYGPLVRSPERRERRRQLGLDPVPLAVTATRTMELPVQTPLFQDESTRIVVLTTSEREAPPSPAKIEVERIPGDELDLFTGMERLTQKYGVRSLLLEGGPTLLAAMVGAGVVNELFLTIAAKLAGSGSEPSILEGEPLAAPLELELKSLMHHEGDLFLRYSLRGASQSQLLGS
jgi:riboflavin-specific deaminase-like protein